MKEEQKINFGNHSRLMKKITNIEKVTDISLFL